MKYNRFPGVMVFLFIMIFFANGFAEQSREKNRPEAYFPEHAFTFDNVLEGTDVNHDFVIKNKGNEALTVERVKST